MKTLKYIYLVYCNPEKLVYGAYLSKKAALKYTQTLIEYRKDMAKKNGWSFSFYHYEEENKRKETDIERREKVIFSCCIRSDKTTEDACWVQCIRRVISK